MHFKDEKNYDRFDNHSNSWHRKVAYYKIYLKNRTKYHLPFGKYEIHHKDGNKNNNHPSNLMLLTPEQHVDIHIANTELKNKNALANTELTKKKARWHDIGLAAIWFVVSGIFLGIGGVGMLFTAKTNTIEQIIGGIFTFIWLYTTTSIALPTSRNDTTNLFLKPRVITAITLIILIIGIIYFV